MQQNMEIKNITYGFIATYKKGAESQRWTYRAIDLISYSSKVESHIIYDRLKPYIYPEIAEEQVKW